MSKLHIEPALLEAVIQGTSEGLEMTGVTPPPVGASRFFTATRPISVMVGMVGRSNGTTALNLSEEGMLHLAGKLIGEEQKELSEDTFDAIAEVGNMVAGRIKELLVDTPYQVENTSVPSVIMGLNYNVHYARGMHTVSVEFELEGLPVNTMKDRFFTTTLSLLRRVA